MSSTQEFVDFVVAQITGCGEIVAKKMFGEYGIYADGKIFGLICNDQLFIKPTENGRAFIGTPTEKPPYDGAKPYFLIESEIKDSVWVSELVHVTVAELPAPKPKKKKQ